MSDAMPERWLPVPGWEPYYAVSDWGRVYSLRKNLIMKPGRKRAGGHHLVNLYLGGKPKTCCVHRLVMAAFVGPCPEGQEVRRNPANNRLSNLAYGTHTENMRDVLVYGTHHQSRKTHCPRGHPYDEVNTLWRAGRKGRDCRACAAINMAASASSSVPDRRADRRTSPVWTGRSAAELNGLALRARRDSNSHPPGS